MLNGLGAGWYDGKGAKETVVVVVGCVKRVWVAVACGFLTNAEVACRLIRWNSAMGRLGAGDDSEFRSSVDMDECEVEKGVGKQACGITSMDVLLNDNFWQGSGSKRSVSNAAETSDVNSAMENGGGDGDRFVVVVAVDILLTSSGRVKNDDDFFSLPIYCNVYWREREIQRIFLIWTFSLSPKLN
jgi:hypothetical protein